MTYRTAVAPRNAALDALCQRLNSGRIEIRTGVQETNLTDASQGTLLGTCLYGNPAYGNSANGVATANAITSDVDADASGDAGHYREYGDGAVDTAPEAQGDAGEAADTPELEFNNKTIVAGGTIAISAATKTLPEQ